MQAVVVQVFKTSRGIFETLNEASKKKNREKNTDPRAPDFGEREPVVPISALYADGQYYQLTPLHVVNH